MWGLWRAAEDRFGVTGSEPLQTLKVIVLSRSLSCREDPRILAIQGLQDIAKEDYRHGVQSA